MIKCYISWLWLGQCLTGLFDLFIINGYECISRINVLIANIFCHSCLNQGVRYLLLMNVAPYLLCAIYHANIVVISHGVFLYEIVDWEIYTAWL